jgi:Ca2+-binding EF-hand superfamily protein
VAISGGVLTASHSLCVHLQKDEELKSIFDSLDKSNQGFITTNLLKKVPPLAFFFASLRFHFIY